MPQVGQISDAVDMYQHGSVRTGLFLDDDAVKSPRKCAPPRCQYLRSMRPHRMTRSPSSIPLRHVVRRDPLLSRSVADLLRRWHSVVALTTAGLRASYPTSAPEPHPGMTPCVGPSGH